MRIQIGNENKNKKNEIFITINNTEYYSSVQSAKSNLYNSIVAIMADLRLDFPDIYPKWEAYLKTYDLEKTTPKLPEINSEKENYFVTGRGIVSNYYSVKNLEQRLSKYTIKAPFKGILTEALVTEGTLIRNNQKLGEYIDPSIYEMEVSLGENYANLLKIGENVKLNNLENTEQFVRVHSGTEYWVSALGFWPGLPFMMPLDPRCKLTAPKYNPPRTWTPKGAVGMGGSSTSIYPDRLPGGYQIFGIIPVPIWDTQKSFSVFEESICLFKPGDRVKFVPTSYEEFDHVSNKVKDKSYDYNIIEYQKFSVKNYKKWLTTIDKTKRF